MKTFVILRTLLVLAVCGIVAVEAEGEKSVRGAFSDEKHDAAIEDDNVSFSNWIALRSLLCKSLTR